MDQKSVIVTGGASGIGAGIVRRLVASDWQVVVFDKQPVKEQPGVVGFEVDITDFDAVRSAVDESVAQLGAPMGLVNNAGWDQAEKFLKTSPELWDKVLGINLRGPLNVTHAVLQHMEQAGRGRVVNIASDAGRVGTSGGAAYSAAKGGTIALMKTLAREHARHGITFNSVSPGPTETPLLETYDETGKLNAALERAIPMGRMAQPEDIAGLVNFLLSDEAGFITGQTVSVSGGLTMHG